MHFGMLILVMLVFLEMFKTIWEFSKPFQRLFTKFKNRLKHYDHIMAPIVLKGGELSLRDQYLSKSQNFCGVVPFV